MKILALVQLFSIKAATAKNMFFSDVHSRSGILYKSAHAGNHTIFVVLKFILVQKNSLQKVLMSDMLTTSSKLIQTTNVHSRTRTVYKVPILSVHMENNDKFAPGSPGAGCLKFPIKFLI